MKLRVLALLVLVLLVRSWPRRTKLRRTHARNRETSSDPIFADRRSARAEFVSLIAGGILCVGSTFGLLWVAALPPFSTASNIEVRNASLHIDAWATYDCPFPVEATFRLIISRNGDAALSFQAIASHEFIKWKPRSSVEFLRRASECSTLEFFVGSLPGTVIEMLEPESDENVWRSLADVSQSRTDGKLTLSMNKEQLQKFSDSPRSVDFRIRELPFERRSYSDRAVNYSATFRAIGDKTVQHRLAIALDGQLEAKTFIPSPTETGFRGVGDYVFLTNSSLPTPFESAAASDLTVRVLYIDVQRKQMQDFLIIVLGAMLGIGAAGLFQAATGLQGRTK